MTLLQIRLENRFDNDILNDGLMSVDGTDFRIQQFRPFSKVWHSHKWKGPGLRYEIGVCIRTGSIVWIHGPFPCGQWPDIKIFRHALADYLEEGERVETDRGYRGQTRHCKIPNGAEKREIRQMRKRVGQRHETVNKRFKQFKCLKETWRHDLDFHSAATRACVIITQLAFENGEPVFDVEYDDLLYEDVEDDSSYNPDEDDNDNSSDNDSEDSRQREYND